MYVAPGRYTCILLWQFVRVFLSCPQYIIIHEHCMLFIGYSCMSCVIMCQLLLKKKRKKERKKKPEKVESTCIKLNLSMIKFYSLFKKSTINLNLFVKYQQTRAISLIKEELKGLYWLKIRLGHFGYNCCLLRQG